MDVLRVLKSLQVAAAHAMLFCFTLLLALKLDRSIERSWWIVFTPVWLFHAVVARGRFSIPAPSIYNDRHWAPMHSVTAMPLLLAFELLLCIYLENIYVIDLKIVFLPLLTFEILILIDNIRMCRALMPGEEETMNDEAVWETLPHFWVSISMIFLIAATAFTLLKLSGVNFSYNLEKTLGENLASAAGLSLCTVIHIVIIWVSLCKFCWIKFVHSHTYRYYLGDLDALGWWDLFVNYGVAEIFAFLNCTKWYNPAIHKRSRVRRIWSSSENVGLLGQNSGMVFTLGEDHQHSRICSLQDIGGHVMKIPIVIFQITLFMRLEGTPSSARSIPILALFSPLLLLQGTGLLFCIYRFLERCILLLHGRALTGRYIRISSKVRDFFEFMLHGSRLLGCWSIDEGSHEELARFYHASSSGYNTFAPDTVKNMPKSELAEEINRLQAALAAQAEVTKNSQEEYERLQNEKILCRVCFEEQINSVLLPCRHHVLCSSCSDRCKKCPICRVIIQERLPVYDV